jgi:thymidylate synthase (FAD)
LNEMEIVRPSHEIWTPLDGDEILRHIEHCGRVAYQSDDRTTPDSAARFVWRLIQRGHESVLEHTNITVNFITDRATANELVRHRMASFTQESTRYVKYDNTRICLTEDAEDRLSDMLDALVESGGAYSSMILDGCAAQTARRVLPLCLATQIVMTANLREWRHVLRIRTARDAHPDMRALMIPLLVDLKNKIPVVFDDILTDVPTQVGLRHGDDILVVCDDILTDAPTVNPLKWGE